MEKEGQISEAEAQRKKADFLLAEEMQKEKRTKSEMESSGFSMLLIVFIENDSQEIVRILEALKERLTPIDNRVLALAYLDLGRKEEGIAESEKSFDDPKLDTAQGHFILAEALKKAGLDQKAEEHYRKAYEMDPENRTYRYEYETIRRANALSKQH